MVYFINIKFYIFIFYPIFFELAACVNLGKEVQILSPGQPPRNGKAIDVGPEAELIVQTEAGLETVRSGEVSVRGLYGYVP